MVTRKSQTDSARDKAGIVAVMTECRFFVDNFEIICSSPITAYFC